MSLNRRFSRKACLTNKVSGFTLIEIMVSLLILSVGLLGMIALQNVALRHNQSAFYDSQAAFLANDILDRIRANKNSGAYSINLGANPPAVVQNCESATCSSSQMAVWDLNQWRTTVNNSNLPLADSAITFNGSDVIITIQYDDRRLDPNDPNPPPPRDYILRSRL